MFRPQSRPGVPPPGGSSRFGSHLEYQRQAALGNSFGAHRRLTRIREPFARPRLAEKDLGRAEDIRIDGFYFIGYLFERNADYAGSLQRGHRSELAS